MRPPRPVGLPKKRSWDGIWLLVIAGATLTISWAMWEYSPWSEGVLKDRVDDHEQRLKALEEGR